jgi:hypothetical protein
MKDSKKAQLRRGATALRQQFAQHPGSIFSHVLGVAEITAVVAAHVHDYRERIYSPLDTLRLFIGQVLSPDRACQDVVGRRLSERTAQGKSPCTLNTGSYCDARARLPVGIPVALGDKIGARLESMAPKAWRWQARHVKLFDGTTVSMPDTPSNQQAFPQSREQKPGLGFPVARIGALIGLASGAVLGYQVAACEGKGTGEQSLLRDLLDHVVPGDVVLADALLATWWIIEGVLARGGDVVMAQHGRRITDFTRGESLGGLDHVVDWLRPPRPKSMSAEQYARYPERLRMREVEVDGRILVTTLLDPQTVSAASLDGLYSMRWNIEVDFRTIKATLQMDVLRCKTQAMIEKEIAVYLLAYNLVRWTMAAAATLADVLPRTLSFTGANRLLAAFADQLRHAPGKRMTLMAGIVLSNIAMLKLPNRPDRIEPRAKKRRPKPLPLLTVPRAVAREEIQRKRALAGLKLAA